MSEHPPPPAVERVLALLNSPGVGFDAGIDQLATPASARQFLARAGLPVAGEPTPAQLAQLRRLRTAMLGLLHERGDSEQAAEALDAIAQSQHFRYRFGAGLEVTLEPVDGGATAQLIDDVAALMREAKWDRVKTCANEACGAIFYDPTRAKTRRWHDYGVCGNKSNVAAFRQRASQADAS